MRKDKDAHRKYQREWMHRYYAAHREKFPRTDS
jgi:hypothetical protein